MVALLWEGKISQTGTDSGQGLVDAFVTHWLQHRPKPLWLLVDPQTSLSKGDFAQFTQYIGIGLAVTPGLIGKSDLQTVGALAASMHNGHHRFRGFSPNQWAFGFDPICDTDDIDSMKINQDHGVVPEQYVRMQQMRDKAAQIWKQEVEKDKWTKLTNTISRPRSSLQIGDWVNVWRSATWKARKKRGKYYSPEPRFVGPGRVALIEPTVQGQEPGTSVIWVVMGSQFSGLEMCARTTTTFYRSRSHLAHFGEGFKDHQTNFGPTEADHWHCGCFS